MFDHNAWTDQSVKKRFKDGAVPRAARHGKGIVVYCKFHWGGGVVGDFRIAGKRPGMMADRLEQQRARKTGGQGPQNPLCRERYTVGEDIFPGSAP